MRHLKDIFPKGNYPNLTVGLDDWDDAAVYQITGDLAVILTLDFFTPIVDDPHDFGAISAANSMSDVYAMGGDVAVALNICGFPPNLPKDIISEILRGGAQKVLEAGGVIAGGHTVDDEEPKYGMVVMGTAHPDKIITNAGAAPGDILVLTKPLGVGIITTALKGGEAKDEDVKAATKSMLKLNKAASVIFRDVGINGLTDITGFSLIGHALEMAKRSGARLCFRLEDLPFVSGAHEYADMWLFPGGTCNNKNAFEKDVKFDSNIIEETEKLLYTPETSGGLLASVKKDKLDNILSRFSDAGEEIWVVGEVMEGSGVEVVE